jgi:hypothetical protein
LAGGGDKHFDQWALELVCVFSQVQTPVILSEAKNLL